MSSSLALADLPLQLLDHARSQSTAASDVAGHANRNLGRGHSRLREWVFGGFTERILTAAPLPVLMAH
jgi:nucleotide-binding universal stress UspA family protein